MYNLTGGLLHSAAFANRLATNIVQLSLDECLRKTGSMV